MMNKKVVKQQMHKQRTRTCRHWARSISLFVLLAMLVVLPAVSAYADRLADADAAARRNDYEAANAIWSELAESGNTDATYSLGLSYLNGRGVEADVGRGLALILKAAGAGNAGAQYYLGSIYEDGEYVEQSGFLAWYWTEKSANQSYAFAQEAMAINHWIRGGPSDRIAALMWIELAIASFQDSEAQRKYAKLLSDRFRADMSHDEIAQAEQAALDWSKKHSKKHSGSE